MGLTNPGNARAAFGAPVSAIRFSSPFEVRWSGPRLEQNVSFAARLPPFLLVAFILSLFPSALFLPVASQSARSPFVAECRKTHGAGTANCRFPAHAAEKGEGKNCVIARVWWSVAPLAHLQLPENRKTGLTCGSSVSKKR